jgi:protein-disulfide isomerase
MYANRLLAAVFLLIIALVSGVSGQTQRSKPRSTSPGTKPSPAKPAETPAKTPSQAAAAAATPTPTPLPAGTLALVNGQPIKLADLPDQELRTVVQGQDAEAVKMRQPALDQMIGELLLENEAKKIGVTVQQLVDQQVKSKVTGPTEEEITAFYNANKQQMNGAELAAMRTQINDYLRNQKAMEIGAQYVAKLKAANQVVNSADVNGTGLPPTTVLVTVNGRKITVGDLDERLKPFIFQMATQIFSAEMDAINAKINDTLLTAEAKKRNVSSDDLMRAEVVSKLTQPSDADIAKFYQENKDKIQGELPSVKTQIAEFLQQQQANKLQYDLAQRLRAGASIQVFLKQPEPPIQAITTEGGVSRGNVNAPVTVVVFTDMECPHCAETHPVLQSVASSYGDKVRLVIRDFPLDMHPEARKAAEAAHAAEAQGKYFEYIEILYKNQKALDVASLKKYATDLALDRTKFDAALDTGKYATVVTRNVSDGQSYAVTSTPTIFVNGVKVSDITEIGIRAAIDRALSKSATSAAK